MYLFLMIYTQWLESGSASEAAEKNRKKREKKKQAQGDESGQYLCWNVWLQINNSLLVIYISVYFLKDSTVSEVNVIAQLKQQIEEAKTNKVNDNNYSNAIIDYWGNNRCT